MEKILFFVTIQDVIPVVVEEVKKAQMDVTVRLWTKASDIPPLSYIDETYDAVVCRGYMYQRLQSQMLTIPVICCPSTVGELLASVRAVQKELGLPRPKIIRLGAVYPAIDEALVSEITETKFRYLGGDLGQRHTVPEAAREAERQGADAVICGPTAEKMIREAGSRNPGPDRSPGVSQLLFVGIHCPGAAYGQPVHCIG